MIPAIVHDGAWLAPRVLRFPEPVEIHMATPVAAVNAGARQVLCLSGEPWPMRPAPRTVLGIAERYELILTWDREILRDCPPTDGRPRAVMLPFGTTWIAPGDRAGTERRDKVFKVTTLRGGKNQLAGHRLRQEICGRADEITIAHEFWTSGRQAAVRLGAEAKSTRGERILPAEAGAKKCLFDAMFHIAIENSQWENYFTEKLIDCFVTRTVPIYWGCPNVGDFFDLDGIIVVRDADEIIAVCNALTPADYTRRSVAIARNRALCEPYCADFAERMRRAIMAHLFAGVTAELSA